VTDDYKTAKKQRMRERYAIVKNSDPLLYGRIVAFSSTVDLTNNDARVTIEDFCMSLAKLIVERS